MSSQRPKLINDPSTCVNEAIEGLVLTNRNLTTICEGRVVIRSDVDSLKAQKKVTIISGGGSGHEPAWAGYVGPGMLTAGVCGNIFASPPTGTVYDAIVKCAAGNEAGCLVIVKNYTGDRVNFGLAIERAKTRGLKCEMLVVGEDCALQSTDRCAGRRGLCGAMLIDKIAGSLSENGKSLEEILQICQDATNRMGTIGCSLGPISLPDSATPLFNMESGQLEIGLGIHGEAGIKRESFCSASELVKKMYEHMTSDSSATRLDIKPGDDVCLVVNNLGGLSVLELSVLTRETILLLESKKIKVKRTFSSAFVTSLDMPGFSITILKVDSELLSLLDAPCSVSAWSAPWDSGSPTSVSIDELDEYSLKSDVKQAIAINSDVALKVKEVILSCCSVLISCDSYLNELDRGCGDGDTGTTMKEGASAIEEYIKPLENTEHVHDLKRLSVLFDKISLLTEKHMGGTSGALYSLFFSAISTELTQTVDMNTVVSAFQSGILAIQKYGRAERGDRTMLDTLFPVLDVLKSEQNSSNLNALLEKCSEAAETGAASTAGMKAKAGRASYTDESNQKNRDPGAEATRIWIQQVCKIIREGNLFSS